MDGRGHARGTPEVCGVGARGVLRSSYMIPMPYDRTLHAAATGRAAMVAVLRRFAERLKALPLDDAAEVLRRIAHELSMTA
jgi:hypothetical protein